MDTKQAQGSTLHLWNKWKEDQDIAAKKQLIENYLPLVQYVSSRIMMGMPKSVSKEDLVSYGIMGLIDAIEKFDVDRGLKFETYASFRIRGAIIDALRKNDWVPRSVRDKSKKIEEAYQKLEQEHLRSVTDEEVSEYLDISLKEFQQSLQEIGSAAIFSLEDPIKEDESETRLSLLIDEQAVDPEQTVNDSFLKSVLSTAIDKLTENERTVVSLYYYEELSLSEIAVVMSLTPSRISQLHSKAILRMRGALQRDRSQLLLDS